MAYGGIIGQSFDDSAIKEYIDQQINELKQQISETSIKIATGSYVGTGRYGASNPTTIIAPFDIKTIILSNEDDGTYLGCGFACYGSLGINYFQSGSQDGSLQPTYFSPCEISSNVFKCYNTHSSRWQFNLKNVHYIIIG